MTSEGENRNVNDAIDDIFVGQKFPSEASEEDQSILALSSDLARIDFSATYGNRSALLHRLLEQLKDSRGESWSIRDRFAMMAYKQRHFAWVVVVIAMVVFLAFARFSPAMAESRQGVGNWVAASTILPKGVQQAIIRIIGAPLVTIQDNSGTTQIHFRSVSSFEQAQAAASFPLKQPTLLPQGYTLASRAVSDDGNWVALTYTNASGDVIHFDQTTMQDITTRAGPSSITEQWQQQVGSSGSQTETGNAMNAVIWKANGVSYTLTGPLSAEQLQSIADSVK